MFAIQFVHSFLIRCIFICSESSICVFSEIFTFFSPVYSTLLAQKESMVIKRELQHEQQAPNNTSNVPMLPPTTTMARECGDGKQPTADSNNDDDNGIRANNDDDGGTRGMLPPRRRVAVLERQRSIRAIMTRYGNLRDGWMIRLNREGIDVFHSKIKIPNIFEKNFLFISPYGNGTAVTINQNQMPNTNFGIFFPFCSYEAEEDAFLRELAQMQAECVAAAEGGTAMTATVPNTNNNKKIEGNGNFANDNNGEQQQAAEPSSVVVVDQQQQQLPMLGVLPFQKNSGIFTITRYSEKGNVPNE